MSTKSTRSFCQKLVWQKNSGGSYKLNCVGVVRQLIFPVISERFLSVRVKPVHGKSPVKKYLTRGRILTPSG